jgi:hypothetical protein
VKLLNPATCTLCSVALSNEYIKPAKLPQHLQTKHKKTAFTSMLSMFIEEKHSDMKISIQKINDKDKKSVYNDRGTRLRKELHQEIGEMQHKAISDLFVRHDFEAEN